MPQGAQWADVSTYADSRGRAQGLAAAISERSALDIVPSENGFSVQANHRQVGVYTVTSLGGFRWGWVEHTDGNGRTEYTDQTQFEHALTRRHIEGHHS